MIQDVIASIVDSMHNTPYGQGNTGGQRFLFLHGTQDYTNWDLDKRPLPVIVLDDLINIDLSQTRTGAILPVYSCLLLFLGKSDLGASPADRLPNMQLMLNAVQEFMLRLDKSPFTSTTQPRSPVQNFKARTVYNYFDANTDGYIVTFDVELSNKGYDYCYAIAPRT